MNSNTPLPDDAFYGRGRSKVEAQRVSPPSNGGRERTIPIKIETQKYSDVSKGFIWQKNLFYKRIIPELLSTIGIN